MKEIILPKKHTRIETLPSGATIEITTRTMQSLMAAGMIPKPLLQKVADLKKDAAGENPVETMQDFLSEMFTFICKHFIRAPKIVLRDADEAAGEVCLADYTKEDQNRILDLFKGIVAPKEDGAELAPFPEERRSPAPGPALREVRPAAVESGGN